MELILLFFIGFLPLLIGSIAYAEVTLPRVFGSNMVLQRNMQAPIWGWAPPGEEITITLSAEAEDVEPVSPTTTAVADANGNWQAKLPAMAAGGPYTLRITGRNTLELTNVLFGEVWVCSGQSNMEWPVSASNNSEEEIAAAMYPKVRLFHIPRVP
ncbi:MAG: sialate O-acetylesterase, partial [Candidatus Poribacteria bacterium]|nr:sialate O-acetylesterase [Candidatus Poribacteria bacterium]